MLPQEHSHLIRKAMNAQEIQGIKELLFIGADLVRATKEYSGDPTEIETILDKMETWNHEYAL